MPLGTSDSGFRAEVESEQALARGEHLLAMTTDHEHDTLAGPAAAEAGQRLDAFAEHARFAGAVITDPRRLKRLMQRHDPDIHPGTYITCVFNPDMALCQPRPDTQGTPRPTASNCQPLERRNTALTADNIAALCAELNHIDHQLQRRPALPPLLQQRLTDRQGKISTFLDRHLAETS